MTKTYVVINRHIIQKNRKTGSRDAPIRVSRGKYGKPEYTSLFSFKDGSQLIYNPDKPMPCGATVYLEVNEG